MEGEVIVVGKVDALARGSLQSAALGRGKGILVGSRGTSGDWAGLVLVTKAYEVAFSGAITRFDKVGSITPAMKGTRLIVESFSWLGSVELYNNLLRGPKVLRGALEYRGRESGIGAGGWWGAWYRPPIRIIVTAIQLTTHEPLAANLAQDSCTVASNARLDPLRQVSPFTRQESPLHDL